MSRLVLHLGNHKTGTTSIQQYLDVAADDVHRQTGLRYVPLRRREQPPIVDRNMDPVRFRSDGTVVRTGYVDHLVASGKDLLVVEENLSWVFAREACQSMLRSLLAVFSDVRVIVYVRRQDRHLISQFQQSSRDAVYGTAFYGPSPTALPRPGDHHDRYLDYAVRLESMAEVLGTERVTVRVFESSRLVDGDAITDFLSIIGASPHPEIDRQRVNESLGKTATKLGHLYNLVPDRQIRSARLATFLPNDDKMLPARSDAEAVIRRYAASNDRLAEMFGLDRPIFDDDVSDYPDESNEPWTPEEIVELIPGLRRAAQRVAARRGLEYEPADLVGREARTMRRRAMAGELPNEDEINRLLLGMLTRLNELAQASRTGAERPRDG